MAQISAADTAWMLMATGLVMLMMPGLALFYGGLVSAKNVLSVTLHCFVAMGLCTVQWGVVGYSLAFGASELGLVGGLEHLFLAGVDARPHGSVPHVLFVAYQGMFAALTPALMAGAVAERMRFGAFCAWVLSWTTLVYDPLAHWAWAPDGWLNRLGALDFAGGTVVHLSSGVSALVAAVMVGPRAGHPQVRRHPHDLTMTTLGAGLLWFGWFGFNGGAGLAADGLAALAVANTQLAAGAGMLGWGLIERAVFGKVTMLGLTSGAVAGLVGITPAAGYVAPAAAVAVGLLTAGCCFLAVVAKGRLGYDDALDAFGIHGVGGAFGALATGMWASRAVNAAGADGLWRGETALMGKQLLALAAVGTYAAAVTWALLWAIRRTLGLRVPAEAEREGLDTAVHGESGYSPRG